MCWSNWSLALDHPLTGVFPVQQPKWLAFGMKRFAGLPKVKSAAAQRNLLIVDGDRRKVVDLIVWREHSHDIIEVQTLHGSQNRTFDPVYPSAKC